ncbi:MAG: cytochrome c3 family protein [Acidobacteria bacterium]|nr:cytochrome c3 family protein [Acidobacteriota bacterium]
MNPRITFVVLATGLLFSSWGLVTRVGAFRLPGNQQGYSPVQPIAYSHRLHAGELQIDCQYCHFNASSSRHAGIPPASICMNCHRLVTTSFGVFRAEDELAIQENRKPRTLISAEIRKIYDALGLDDERKPAATKQPAPIAWTRVHRLPAFVYFDHRAHVNAGVVCQTCHGPVETMERMRQFSDLTMGWCVNCHREVNRSGVEGKRVYASVDCSTCHF